MTITLSPANGCWDQQLARWLVRPLRDTRLRPNHITTVTLILGIITGVVFARYGTKYADWAALLFVVAVFTDHMDGELARMSNKISPLGYYYDYIVGGIIYTIMFSCIGWGLWQESQHNSLLVIGFMAGLCNLLTLYLRMKMEFQFGKQETVHPWRCGINVEDFIYLMAPITWFFGIYYFFIPYAIGSFGYFAWTLIEIRRCRQRRK